MARILVVDDEASVRTSIKYFLGKIHGHEITEANDAFQAFNSYREKGKFDLVITDYDMPGMDGIILIEKIRAINPLQCAVLMSGNKIKTDLVFIEKPFLLAKLFLIVSRVLSS